MSVEPVTVTTTTEDSDGEIQHGLARAQAAAEIGLEPGQIVCLVVSPVGIQPASEIIDPDTKLPVRPAKYTFESTWAPKSAGHSKEKAPEPLPWPDVKLPRGARWHGMIPDEHGEPLEALLISDGERLLLIDSAEGKLLMNEMGGEKPTTTILPANTFG